VKREREEEHQEVVKKETGKLKNMEKKKETSGKQSASISMTVWSRGQGKETKDTSSYMALVTDWQTWL
jgi:hypothetical protein